MEPGFTFEADVWNLKDGQPVVIRPIRPDDEPRMRAFHRTLSEQSVYNRYFGVFKLDQRITHERLARICHIDRDQEMALIVEHHEEGHRREIIGVGRLTRLEDPTIAEFAIVIADPWQGKGLGSELLRRLVDIGRQHGLATIRADILTTNRAMQKVARKAGFRKLKSTGVSECQMEKRL